MKHFYRFIFLALGFSPVYVASAQKQTNKWYFGLMAGLDFNTTSPTVLTNGFTATNEGTASMSDVNGNLLFYTDGVTVWNNTHASMPNGTGLLGDVSTTQSALIVKKPGSSTLYYLFTLPAEGTGNFCYSIVDMTLDNGKGDVTNKNTVLKANVTEKMSATYHCNGTDVWITIHELNSKSFYSYLLSASGVGTPVVSTTGRTFTKVHGQMKFNTKGSMIAAIRDTILQTSPYNGKSYVDVCLFNNQTGVVTYSYTLLNGSWQNAYGLEFSPDNSKLYVSCYDQSGLNGGNSEVRQYNLNTTNVQASSVSVGNSTDPNILRALQLASNGKIYASKSISPFLCEINSPNAVGAACNYTDNAINIDPNGNGAMCMLGLPGFVQNYFEPSFPTIVSCPTAVGVNEIHSALVRSYYNQSNSTLMIFGTETSSSRAVTITDIQGKLMGKVAYRQNAESLNIHISELPAGIYFVRLESAGGTTVTKFIKPE